MPAPAHIIFRVAFAKQAKKKGESGGKLEASRTKGGKQPVGPPTAVFTVEPDAVTLKPRTACVFTFRGASARVGEVLERLECNVRVGSDKSPKVMFTCALKANMLLPLLTVTFQRACALQTQCVLYSCQQQLVVR